MAPETSVVIVYRVACVCPVYTREHFLDKLLRGKIAYWEMEPFSEGGARQVWFDYLMKVRQFLSPQKSKNKTVNTVIFLFKPFVR